MRMPGASVVFTMFVAAVAVGAGAQVAHPAAPHRHPEAQALVSPVAATPENLAAGKRLFLRFCASCHGPQGKGDGGMAVGGGQPSDLTDNVYQHGSSEGEIFAAIRDGVSQDMEAWKERIPGDGDIWKIAVFVRSLGKPEDRKP